MGFGFQEPQFQLRKEQGLMFSGHSISRELAVSQGLPPRHPQTSPGVSVMCTESQPKRNRDWAYK